MLVDLNMNAMQPATFKRCSGSSHGPGQCLVKPWSNARMHTQIVAPDVDMADVDEDKDMLEEDAADAKARRLKQEEERRQMEEKKKRRMKTLKMKMMTVFHCQRQKS